MHQGIEKLKDYYASEVDSFTRFSTGRSFEELTKIIEENEIIKFLLLAYYSGQMGLLMITNERSVFASRKKNDTPKIFQFDHSELSNVIIDNGILNSNIRFTTPFADKIIDRIVKTEARPAYDYLISEITKNRITQEKKTTVLDIIFDQNEGWPFNEEDVFVEQDASINSSTQYFLTVMNQRLKVYQTWDEYREIFQESEIKGDISTIVIIHEIFGIGKREILNVKNKLPERLTSATIINENRIAIFSSFPAISGTKTAVLRNQLFASVIVLLKRKAELNSLLEKYNNERLIADTEINEPDLQDKQQDDQFSFSDLVRFAGSVVDVVSIVSGGEANSDNND